MAVQIGCGSWADPKYAGLLYPKGFPADLRLSGYAMWFDRIEVNSTYYGVPNVETVHQWCLQTPEKFLFDIRLHQAFSRSPVKSVASGLWERFFDALQPLAKAKKLGTFLLVLPPNFAPARHQLNELDALLAQIKPRPLAIELRHFDWVTGSQRVETLSFFRERKVAWVAVDMPQIKGANLMPAVDVVTNPKLAYLRLHGRNPNYMKGMTAAEKHAYAYTEQDLKQIIRRIQRLSDHAENVRVSANNHFLDYAPRTALRLQQLLG